MFWVKAGEDWNRIFAELLQECPAICGGKLHAVVRVGHIKDGHYFLHKPEALRGEGEFKLPAFIQCTNCRVKVDLAEECADTLLEEALEFVGSLRKAEEDLQEARRAAQAPWN